MATELRGLDDLGRQHLKAQRSLHQEPHRARRRGLRRLGHPRLYLARTSGSDLPGAELGRCNRHLNQDLPACGGAEGVAGPIPGALGNRDLVVVVGVAPVNLAGLNIADPVLGDRATGERFLEHSQPLRVDPTRLIAPLAELADVAI